MFTELASRPKHRREPRMWTIRTCRQIETQVSSKTPGSRVFTDSHLVGRVNCLTRALFPRSSSPTARPPDKAPGSRVTVWWGVIDRATGRYLTGRYQGEIADRGSGVAAFCCVFYEEGM